jgi:hypothetical protein
MTNFCNKLEKKHLVKLMIGSRVVRGPDWKWEKQDGIYYFLNIHYFLHTQLQITNGEHKISAKSIELEN